MLKATTATRVTKDIEQVRDDNSNDNVNSNDMSEDGSGAGSTWNGLFSSVSAALIGATALFL